MPTLLELQCEFAAHLSGDNAPSAKFVADGAIPAASRVAVYRNNSRSFFENALRGTYPVIERRVGTDYFKQLATHYREVHPSRSGDLHWIGRDFAAFLAAHLADSPYVWLAELAALEWAVAAAAVAADSARAELALLSAYPPEQLGELRFAFVPSLHTLDASVPVLTVWRGNQAGLANKPVDLSSGGECVVVHRAASNNVELRRVTPAELSFLRALQCGRRLGEALDESELPLESFQRTLAWLFADGCVAAIKA
jgi:hypothetical protein